MKKNLNKNSLIRYSRQIILKNIGTIGQKKILNSKVLIVGAGGLGCPVADLLTRSGVGEIGVIDYDKVSLSNIHRQTLYTTKDVNKYKVNVVKKKLNLINKEVKINIYNKKANEKNLNNIINEYDIIVDGSDNFQTKFLLNKFSLNNSLLNAKSIEKSPSLLLIAVSEGPLTFTLVCHSIFPGRVNLLFNLKLQLTFSLS